MPVKRYADSTTPVWTYHAAKYHFADASAKGSPERCTSIWLFIAKVGREKVCFLLKGKVEKPSDMDGIAYIPFNNSIGEIQQKILKELEASGVIKKK